jgi:hypothetical protein
MMKPDTFAVASRHASQQIQPEMGMLPRIVALGRVGRSVGA